MESEKSCHIYYIYIELDTVLITYVIYANISALYSGGGKQIRITKNKQKVNKIKMFIANEPTKINNECVYGVGGGGQGLKDNVNVLWIF